MALKCPVPKRRGAELSSAESAAPSRRRRNGPTPQQVGSATKEKTQKIKLQKKKIVRTLFSKFCQEDSLLEK